MKIELSQSGGYAGETIKLKEISTDKISDAARAQLTALLKETDFFNTKTPATAKRKGADFLTYNLKISGSKNQSREISITDPGSDKAFSKLLALVKSL